MKTLSLAFQIILVTVAILEMINGKTDEAILSFVIAIYLMIYTEFNK